MVFGFMDLGRCNAAQRIKHRADGLMDIGEGQINAARTSKRSEQKQKHYSLTMVSDQEIAKGVETLLRQSDRNASTSLNGVVKQLEAKLGLDLSHKAGFIRDQISLLLRSHPTPQQVATNTQPQPQPQPQQLPPKDHFTLQHHPQFSLPPQQFPPHFALHHPHPHLPQFPQELNFSQPQPSQAAAPPPQPHSNVSKAEAFPQISAEVAKEKFYASSLCLTVESTALQMLCHIAVRVYELDKRSDAFMCVIYCSPPVGAKRRGGPGGLNKVCGVSPELQAVVGQPAMPRTEIVKQLWAYIRKNNLQDPSNKRKIICDDALRVVFETDCTDMFKMNKLLAKHIIPLEPTKESSKRFKPDAESTTEGMESGPSSVIISEALAKFLGTGGREMLQAEATKRVWEYIKVNHLEDPLNSMVILCDAKLRELLGCESISALGIQEMLARNHFLRQS
ncbi:SWIB complex BAF60b domain-containing protein [Citrus sinensis]|uniref:SWIB complex BAF60b domain-containing protein n=1 Tax=Citrus sinensis TaxID=2711 RepID=A0ACB8NKA2_CITSI|nr:SWIB complex BAF60b domain-containing protein [Citrus sinensis]